MNDERRLASLYARPRLPEPELEAAVVATGAAEVVVEGTTILSMVVGTTTGASEVVGAT